MTEQPGKASAIGAYAKAMAEDDARRAPYLKHAEASERLRDDWLTKWYLALAVGNGAGCIGLTSALVNTWGKMPSLPFLLGLWSFALGLLAAGALPFLQARAEGRSREMSLARYFSNPHGRTYYTLVKDDPQPTEVVADAHLEAMWRWKLTSTICQAFSAAGFATGIILPLALLTFHCFGRCSI